MTIADARGDADTAAERNGVSNNLASADKELERHGKAGTQLDKVGKLEKVHVAVGRPIKGCSVSAARIAPAPLSPRTTEGRGL